jgi:hypothetical protein
MYKDSNIAYGTIISPVVSYGHETCSLTLRKEYSSKELKKCFGPKRHDETGIGEGYIRRIFICSHQILLG